MALPQCWASHYAYLPDTHPTVPCGITVVGGIHKQKTQDIIQGRCNGKTNETKYVTMKASRSVTKNAAIMLLEQGGKKYIYIHIHTYILCIHICIKRC